MITILEDTRQQEKKHENKHAYFREKGILWRRVALDCGDYTLPNDRSVAIDTKKDLGELVNDIQAKTIPKKEVRALITDIFNRNGISQFFIETAYKIITDDDDGRFPEGEIEYFCNVNLLNDAARKDLKKVLIKYYGFFHRGIKRAENNMTKLIILIECPISINSISDVENWVNPRQKGYEHKVRKEWKIPRGSNFSE